ncbi:hypothetical protein DB345_08495 [Spartobacteria bacterium LR76]|nr:hypothetical protein DB345_08495 [Spartobacteria bacterium LR76]
MNMRRRDLAFTSAEAVLAACLAVLLLLVLFASLPSITVGGGPGLMTEVLSKMRRLQIATKQMSLDDRDAEWTCNQGKPMRYADWTNRLVTGGYVSAKDMALFTSAQEYGAFWFTPLTTNALTVFAVENPDADSTLLLATRNWHGPAAPNLAGLPFQKRGFIVFRKGGDGAILLNSQCQRTDLIGSGGKFNYLPLP